MSFPVIRSREAFDSDPLDSTPSYADLSTRVEVFNFDYGKQSELDDFQPGTSSVVLKNDDRELDPLHAAGTYFGKVKPRKRCVVDATINGTTYDQGTTLADGWPQSGFTLTTSEVDLHGTDLFIVLANIDLPESVWTKDLLAAGPVQWWRLNESSAGQAISDSAGGRAGTVVGDPSAAEGLITGSSDTAIEFDGASYIDLDSTGAPPPPPYSVGAWIKTPNTTTGQNRRIIWQYADAIFLAVYDSDHLLANKGRVVFVVRTSASGYSNSSPGLELVNDNNPHLIGVSTADGLTFKVFVDGVLSITHTATPYVAGNTASIGGAFKPIGSDVVQFIGTIDEAQVFDTELDAGDWLALHEAGSLAWDGDTTGERIDRILDYCGIEAGDRDIDTGVTILGPTVLGGDALSYLQLVAMTEDGQFFVEHRNGGKLTFYDRYVRFTATRSTTSQATFTDDPAASAPAYRFEPDDLVLTDDESQIVNEAVVQWDQGEVRVSDAASITAYGRKSRTYATLLKTAGEAQSRAEWIVANYKDAHVRIESLTLKPAADSRLWEPALGLRYLDRVTFRFKPQNLGTAIQQDYWVQGVHVEASEGVNHFLTRYYLTPASAVGADIEVFILDSSLLDSDAILV